MRLRAILVWFGLNRKPGNASHLQSLVKLRAPQGLRKDGLGSVPGRGPREGTRRSFTLGAPRGIDERWARAWVETDADASASSMELYVRPSAPNTGYWPMASKPGLGADTNTDMDTRTADNNRNLINTS